MVLRMTKLNKIIKISIISLIIGLLFSQPAYAYLDPGTGSVLLQGLLAGFAGFLAVLKLYWQRVKRFFIVIKNKVFCREAASKSHE